MLADVHDEARFATVTGSRFWTSTALIEASSGATSGIACPGHKAEAHLDGKWLPSTSDAPLTAEDLAAAYKQLRGVERG